ncbi:Type 1 glutamine amidotransferase-like domain-containing protein [Lactococcus petauri]|uniref:Type 1 glutamine amidotransferase-like domain-containing protein n=1 Tax=Lactococcus petauri TaxID=1940789 RepID=UPI00254DD7A8|nr:Type 1 glutamine amidotransferase-like domain-containing protein [Lactococcus petauri]
MTKKLFLTSYFKKVAPLLPDFTGKLYGKKIVFIPTASNVEKVNFFVNSGKKVLENLGGIVDVLDLSTADEREIKTKISNNDIIYVSGGNTFFLLQEMKRTGAFTLIKNEINSGKIYNRRICWSNYHSS